MVASKFEMMARIRRDRKHGTGREKAQGMWKWDGGSVGSWTSCLAPAGAKV